LAEGLGPESEALHVEEAEARDDETSSDDEEEVGDVEAESAESVDIALLDQSEAEADADAGIELLIHSEEETEALISLDIESVGDDVADGEAASVDTDGRLELSLLDPEAEAEADAENESVIETEALGSGCIGTCPVGATQMVWVEVMSTTTVVVAVIGSPLWSKPKPGSIPRVLACW
jgi:hypothetical protein